MFKRKLPRLRWARKAPVTGGSLISMPRVAVVLVYHILGPRAGIYVSIPVDYGRQTDLVCRRALRVFRCSFSQDLPVAFALPAAYGNFIAATLAVLALAGPEEQVRYRLVVGVQHLGQCGSPLRLLPGQSFRVRAGSVGGHLLHRDLICTAAPDHARACVPASAAK